MDLALIDVKIIGKKAYYYFNFKVIGYKWINPAIGTNKPESRFIVESCCIMSSILLKRSSLNLKIEVKAFFPTVTIRVELAVFGFI